MKPILYNNRRHTYTAIEAQMNYVYMYLSNSYDKTNEWLSEITSLFM